MDLNNINLTASVLAGLYKDSLVEMSESNPVSEPVHEKKTSTPATPILKDNSLKFLGENQKNILILVAYDTAVHIPDEQLNFLTSMLSACKLNLGDVSIFNEKNKPGISYKELLDFFKSKVILLLGTEPVSLGLPISFPEFQVQAFNNTTFLFTPSLEIMENDKVLKSKLWVCLRRIFDV
jgi:hypothetical protein